MMMEKFLKPQAKVLLSLVGRKYDYMQDSSQKVFQYIALGVDIGLVVALFSWL